MRSHGEGELPVTQRREADLPVGPELRGMRRLPLSTIGEGRFGRMFRRLSPMPPLPDEVLRDLSEGMRDPESPTGWDGSPQSGDNPRIPAGYTYLGQFVDHDVTFDPTSSLQRQNDPDALHDFRTPRFDLDSLYGSGPVDEPFQYERGTNGLRLLIEPNRNGVEDLPRNSQDVALIGDPRNDENTIIGQLQLLFLRLHNRLGEQIFTDATVPEEMRFQETQRRVRWHYQWVVVTDFLRRVIGDELFVMLYASGDDGLPDIRRRYYRPKTAPYMPVEFSAAAFRYGHSQIRGIYDLSAAVTQRPIFVPRELPDPFADLRGFRPLPPGWTIDWSRFFAVDGSSPQLGRRIDSRLVAALFELPSGGGSLAFRNLKRGQVLGLPSGQDVAKYLAVERVFTGAELEAPEPTPLWFYVLKESELITGGEHLGPVGGRIVGEVLLGMLEGDPQSWYNVNRGWRPTLPDADGDGQFTMADLVRAATG